MLSSTRIKQYVVMTIIHTCMLLGFGVFAKPMIDKAGEIVATGSFQQMASLVAHSLLFSVLWIPVYIAFKQCEKKLVETRRTAAAIAAISVSEAQPAPRKSGRKKKPHTKRGSNAPKLASSGILH